MNAPLPPDAVAVAMLPIAQIVSSTTNPRKHFDDAYLAELAESIKSHGVIQPITVRPNPLDTNGLWPYEIVVGECRWRAAKLAGIEQIPGFWRELDDKQVLEIQVIENLQRRDVSEVEEADGYRSLVNFHGYTADALAARIGKSRAYVYARLKLTELCPVARSAFYEGKLDASTALLIARIRSEALQTKAIAEVTKPRFDGSQRTYRDNKNYLQHEFTISLKQATFKLDDAELLPQAGSCSACSRRSGNDPAIYEGIDDADICTDVKCFDDKRQARRDQLVALAEKRKIPVFKGSEVDFGARHTDDDEDGYVLLDDECPDDAEGRSYRQILGDKAPIAAMIEIGFGERDKHLEEAATPTALGRALKKAGWQPIEAPPPAEEPAEQKAEREAVKARMVERDRQLDLERAAREAEERRRQQLQGQLLPILKKLSDNAATTQQALAIALVGILIQDFAYVELPHELLEQYGVELPDEYDENDELPKIAAAMRTWPVAHLAAFVVEWLDEARNAREPTRTLDPLAEILGLSTPTQAAQAQGDNAPRQEAKGKAKAAKKPKAKAGTAAPTAPNEPAAPAETSALANTAWPFPTGARI